MLNKPLLQQTLGYIEDHPREWDQRMWAARGDCGTTYCFAGTALHLSGAEFVFDADSSDPDCAWDVLAASLTEDVRGRVHANAKGWVGAIFAAKELLGLSDTQADGVFFGIPNLNDLRQAVAELLASE